MIAFKILFANKCKKTNLIHILLKTPPANYCCTSFNSKKDSIKYLVQFRWTLLSPSLRLMFSFRSLDISVNEMNCLKFKTKYLHLIFDPSMFKDIRIIDFVYFVWLEPLLSHLKVIFWKGLILKVELKWRNWTFLTLVIPNKLFLLIITRPNQILIWQ